MSAREENNARKKSVKKDFNALKPNEDISPLGLVNAGTNKNAERRFCGRHLMRWLVLVLTKPRVKLPHSTEEAEFKAIAQAISDLKWCVGFIQYLRLCCIYNWTRGKRNRLGLLVNYLWLCSWNRGYVATSLGPVETLTTQAFRKWMGSVLKLVI